MPRAIRAGEWGAIRAAQKFQRQTAFVWGLNHSSHIQAKNKVDDFCPHLKNLPEAKVTSFVLFA